jgi:hypothetical protein
MIGNNIDKYTDENFKEKICKIENLAKQWCLRNLTLKGKVTVVNTLFISQLLYLGSCMYTPKWVLARYKEIVTKFIWNNKPPKVKYTTMIKQVEDGGLNLHDLECKIKSMKINWIKKLYDPKVRAPWKTKVESHFKVDIKEIINANLSAGDYPTFGDKFYTEMWQTWTEISNQNPTGIEQICNQRICNNAAIKIGCRPVDKKEWTEKHLIFIKDLFNDKGNFLTERNINTRFNILLKNLEYNSLISAIPHNWKKTIKNEYKKLPTIVPNQNCTLTLNKMTKELTEITTKEIYSTLLEKISKRPTSEQKWLDTELLDVNDWTHIYQSAFKLTTDTKLQTFQFKITHRILACKTNLFTWKIEANAICNFCGIENDTIEHHLVMCKDTLEFWSHVRNWWKAITDTNLVVGIYDLILGLPNDEKNSIINQFNFVLLYTRYYIYANKQAGKAKLHLYELLIKLKTRLEIMQNIALENKQEKKFEENWSELFNGI